MFYTHWSCRTFNMLILCFTKTIHNKIPRFPVEFVLLERLLNAHNTCGEISDNILFQIISLIHMSLHYFFLLLFLLLENTENFCHLKELFVFYLFCFVFLSQVTVFFFLTFSYKTFQFTWKSFFRRFFLCSMENYSCILANIQNSYHNSKEIVFHVVVVKVSCV